MDKKQKKHFGVGISICLPMGIVLGLSFNNIVFGIISGLIMGIIVEFVIHFFTNKNKRNINSNMNHIPCVQ